MKIILLQDVSKIGKKYQIKVVPDGYALNYLFPRKLACLASKEAIASLEKKQKEMRIEQEIQDDLLDKNLADLKGKEVNILVKADDKGHLFKAIREVDIVQALSTEHHIFIDEKFIKLPKPIKQVGEFEIEVNVKNKTSTIKLIIKPSK